VRGSSGELHRRLHGIRSEQNCAPEATARSSGPRWSPRNSRQPLTRAASGVSCGVSRMKPRRAKAQTAPLGLMAST
jgi:hypothetical protein